ncbi:hypothetical protein LINPERPRIM_LOCUS39372 [Linum perenne]
MIRHKLLLGNVVIAVTAAASVPFLSTSIPNFCIVSLSLNLFEDFHSGKCTLRNRVLDLFAQFCKGAQGP